MVRARGCDMVIVCTCVALWVCGVNNRSSNLDVNRSPTYVYFFPLQSQLPQSPSSTRPAGKESKYTSANCVCRPPCNPLTAPEQLLPLSQKRPLQTKTKMRYRRTKCKALFPQPQPCSCHHGTLLCLSVSFYSMCYNSHHSLRATRSPSSRISSGTPLVLVIGGSSSAWQQDE